MNAQQMGYDASQVLSSAAFRGAVTKLRDEIVSDIESLSHDGSPETDRKKDLLFCELQVCKRFLGRLNIYVRAGKIEADKEARTQQKVKAVR